MNQKIKTQKGFIQISLLVEIIIAVVITSAVGTGVVLHRQGKLDSFLANISQTFTKTEEPITAQIKEVGQEKVSKQPSIEELLMDSQLEQEREVEKINQEAEKAKRLLEEQKRHQATQRLAEERQRQQELERQRQLEIQLLADEFEIAKSKVEQNELFPLITGYIDSKGNCRCSSGYNKVSCSGCPYFAESKLRVGETIRMEVSAISSKNSSVIEYKFVSNVKQKPIKNWSNENFAEYTVPNIPYSSFGITVLVRNDYPQRRSVNNIYDDYIQIMYEVIP